MIILVIGYPVVRVFYRLGRAGEVVEQLIASTEIPEDTMLTAIAGSSQPPVAPDQEA